MAIKSDLDLISDATWWQKKSSQIIHQEQLVNAQYCYNCVVMINGKYVNSILFLILEM